MKILREKTAISVSHNKILSEIVIRKKRYRIMQSKEGAVGPTDAFEIGTLFDKNIIKLTTTPQKGASGEEILLFKERTVFYMEVD
jgi:hypothetical protein